MSYIVENLKPNEKIMFETKLHWISIVITALWSWILLFIPLIIVVLKYITTEFAVTNQRIVIKHGIISKNIDEAPLDKIQNITFRQSFIGRIFDYGTIVVQTAATFGGDNFPYIMNPNKLRKTVSEQMDLYKDAQMQKQAEMIAKGIKQSV
ncbi:MAG: PH domain-containing protein [Euryarchaeota archaeon]|nr:PH domain-containing protein [Euryarchaeota archaeon]